MRTPYLLLDGGALDRNLAAMQTAADAAGVRLRPHVKGHKCAWIAARQLRAGAAGLAAATLEEAAGLLRAGLGQDVLVTSDLPRGAIEEVVALNRLGDLAVAVDDPAFVRALGAAAGVPDRPLRVFLDLDVGQGRGGARTPEEAVALADAVAAEPAVALGGVQAYEGHIQLKDDDERRAGHTTAMARLEDFVRALRDAGHRPPVVTSAGTGTAPLVRDPVTEIQPGSYALMDHTYRGAGARFEQALHLVSAVRSRTADDRAIVDAGLKALSIDMGRAKPDGLAATWSAAGDEHGILEGDLGDLGDLAAGDEIRLVPSHGDTTIRLHRELWLDGAVSLPLF